MMKNIDLIANQVYTVEIFDSALPDGYGVAKYDNFIIFVPGALPGEKVKVKISKITKSFAYGEIMEIIEKSPFEIQSPCPNHSNLCGGCLLINLDYQVQLNFKKKHLTDTLAKIGSIDRNKLTNINIIPSPDIYFYRNKMEFSFGEHEGKLILGLRERVSPLTDFQGKVINITDCAIFSPKLAQIFDFFTRELNKLGLKAYNLITGKGFLRNLVIREAKNTGEIMVILSTAQGEIPEINRLAEKLFDTIKEIKSFYFVENKKQGNLFVYDKIKYTHGSDFIIEKLGDLLFHIYPDTFFQPNTKIAQIMYETVTRIISEQNKKHILGLYCGSGTMELFLAKNIISVTGIDCSAKNISAALDNARINNIYNTLFYKTKTENFQGFGKSNYDAVIVDPPRSGLSGKTINLLSKSNINTILYLSCNPSTLARDVKTFKGKGFLVRDIDSFDQFPHTGHLETLITLNR